MTNRQLNTTSVYRRLSQVALSVVLLIVVLDMWISANSVGEKLQSDHTASLTRQLAQQSALVAMRFIKQKQADELTVMLNDLITDPFIQQSMVYDKTGKIIAQSADSVTAHQAHIDKIEPFDALTPVNAPLPPSPQLKMYVTEIYDDDKLLGYLRIGYLQTKAIKEPLLFHNNIMRQILLMMLICGVIGFMLTRGFARFSRNSYRIVD
jgi:membrane protein